MELVEFHSLLRILSQHALDEVLRLGTELRLRGELHVHPADATVRRLVLVGQERRRAHQELQG